MGKQKKSGAGVCRGLRRLCMGGFACLQLWLAQSVPGMGASAACTGMYAGKRVTADGSVLIGRTVDFSPYNATMFQQICETQTQVAFNGETNRYRYVCTPLSTSLNLGRCAGGAANEKGVVLAGTIPGATRDVALREEPFVAVAEGGVGGSNLPDYLIGNAATAREAVDLLASAIAANGHAEPGIYMVADAKRLYDELLWYAAANNRISGDGSGATDEPTEAFVPTRPGKEVR